MNNITPHTNENIEKMLEELRENGKGDFLWLLPFWAAGNMVFGDNKNEGTEK